MDFKKFLQQCLNYKVLIAIIASIAALYLLAPQLAQYSWLLLVLACPLSMLLMMHGMRDGHTSEGKLFVCPECNFSYKDAEWAKKCAAWCKEHKSCNLEITQHATNNT